MIKKNQKSRHKHNTLTQYLDTVISFNSSYSTSDLWVCMINMASTQAYTLTKYNTTVSELLLLLNAIPLLVLDICDAKYCYRVDKCTILVHKFFMVGCPPNLIMCGLKIKYHGVKWTYIVFLFYILHSIWTDLSNKLVNGTVS